MGLSRQEYWSGLPFPPPGTKAWQSQQVSKRASITGFRVHRLVQRLVRQGCAEFLGPGTLLPHPVGFAPVLSRSKCWDSEVCSKEWDYAQGSQVKGWPGPRPAPWGPGGGVVMGWGLKKQGGQRCGVHVEKHWERCVMVVLCSVTEPFRPQHLTPTTNLTSQIGIFQRVTLEPALKNTHLFNSWALSSCLIPYESQKQEWKTGVQRSGRLCAGSIRPLRLFSPIRTFSGQSAWEPGRNLFSFLRLRKPTDSMSMFQCCCFFFLKCLLYQFNFWFNFGKSEFIQRKLFVLLSHVRLFVTPWSVARQAPLSVESSRQED